MVIPLASFLKKKWCSIVLLVLVISVKNCIFMGRERVGKGDKEMYCLMILSVFKMICSVIGRGTEYSRVSVFMDAMS
jgi:hypothetical protein